MRNTLTLLRSPVRFRIYLLLKLPLAWIMGLSIKAINESYCTVSLPFKRVNYNPFKSMYFAAQIAAAELSTGLLLLTAIGNNRNISFLVKHVESSFSNKATTTINFTCNDGFTIQKAVKQAVNSNEVVSVIAESIGVDKSGQEVSRSKITWSIKRIK